MLFQNPWLASYQNTPLYLKLSVVYIALFLLLGISFPSKAQFISIEAIEIGSTSQSGTSKLPAATTFISNTRNPALFRTSINSEIIHPDIHRKEGFRIDFIFRLKNDLRHQFVAGFERTIVESDLFSVDGTIQDTLSVAANYRTRNEFFLLKSGYQLTLRPEKRLSLIAGGQLNVGIPVSARTEEVVFYREFGSEELRFFGKQSASAGISIPFSVRLKVVRNISISLLITQSFQYYRIDGTPVFASMQGTNLGFHFRLRDL